MSNHSCYLTNCFNPENSSAIIEQIKEELNGVEFDSFIVRGLSGVIMGTLAASAMGKKLTVVRKPNEDSHGSSVENWETGDVGIVLDDFICSGDTLKAILMDLPCSVVVKGFVPYSKGSFFLKGKTADAICEQANHINVDYNNGKATFRGKSRKYHKEF